MALSKYENLPLGFRFKPTDVELINHYLRLKINGKHNEVSCIKEVDICKVEPWELPDLSAIKTCDHEWFFFCPRDRKYPNGHRSNRATGVGFWKGTGKDRTIRSRKTEIGMKKTLVFYRGRAPKGVRTHWVIHEYRPLLQELDGTNPGQEPFVLCRLFKKADDLKQDENDDGSNISPTPNDTTQEDDRSKLCHMQASPAIGDWWDPDFLDIDDDNLFNILDDQVGPPCSELFSLDFALTERDVRENADVMGWKNASTIENSGSAIDVSQLQHDSGVTGSITSPCNETKLSWQPGQSNALDNVENKIQKRPGQFWIKRRAAICNQKAKRIRLRRVSVENLNAEEEYDDSPSDSETGSSLEQVVPKSDANLCNQKPSFSKKSVSMSSKGSGCRPILYIGMVLVLMVSLFMGFIGLWKSHHTIYS